MTVTVTGALFPAESETVSVQVPAAAEVTVIVAPLADVVTIPLQPARVKAPL